MFNSNKFNVDTEQEVLTCHELLANRECQSLAPCYMLQGRLGSNGYSYSNRLILHNYISINLTFSRSLYLYVMFIFDLYMVYFTCEDYSFTYVYARYSFIQLSELRQRQMKKLPKL